MDRQLEMCAHTTTPEVNYEAVWQGAWNDTTRYGPACRHRRRLVTKLLRSVPHATILDLGCGDGTLLAELAGQVDARVEGADVSEEALVHARTLLPDVPLHQVDLDCGYSLGDFDVVILSEVLEHIEDDAGVLRELAPHARHVVISVPGGPPDKVDEAYGHFRNYSGDHLFRLLEETGYDVVRFFRWGFPFYEAMMFCSRFSSNPAALSGGPFGPTKKVLAFLGYYLFLLNVYRGSQVFALARSRRFGE